VSKSKQKKIALVRKNYFLRLEEKFRGRATTVKSFFPAAGTQLPNINNNKPAETAAVFIKTVSPSLFEKKTAAQHSIVPQPVTFKHKSGFLLPNIQTSAFKRSKKQHYQQKYQR
jgi:hypothetical protein